MEIKYECPWCNKSNYESFDFCQGYDHAFTETECEHCEKPVSIEVESSIEIVGLTKG